MTTILSYVQILCRGKVTNTQEFLEEFGKSTSIRAKAGCSEHLVFSYPKDVISVFFKWDSLENFQKYRKTPTEADAEFCKNMDYYPLNPIKEWFGEPTNNLHGDELFVYCRQSIIKTDNFVELFTTRYDEKMMESMGIKEYRLFEDYRNPMNITFFSIWNSIEDYNSSDQKFEELSEEKTLTSDGIILFTDIYKLKLEDIWTNEDK